MDSTRPTYESPPRIAIVGAGISGLICGRMLQDRGLTVKIFEKSRGVGGRMATRRTDQGPHFDHGAQYFTVRDERFEQYVQAWVRDGIVAEWQGRIATLTKGHIEPKQRSTSRFVGVPGMNAICKHLATDLDIQFQTRIVPPVSRQNVWQLQHEDGTPLGDYDCVITTAPAPQSAELLGCAPTLAKKAKAANMSGCWAAMLAFDQPLELEFDGAFVHDSPLSWIARNESKPGRGGEAGQLAGKACWVLHASAEWTDQHIDEDGDDILPQLIDAFWHSTTAAPQDPTFAIAHRWRYAIPTEPLEDRCLFDPELGVGACGDWCGGPRVEGAFRSGVAMADRVFAAANE